MKPRRNGYYQPRNGNGGGAFGGFNLATLAQMLLIPALGVVGTAYVFKDRVDRHDAAIYQDIPKKFEAEEAAIKAEQDAREKTRNEFLAKFDKLNEGVAGLNTKAALADERNATIVQTLGQIRDQLAAGSVKR